MLWASDRSSAVIYAGAEWEALSGQRPDDAKGEGWVSRLHEADRDLALKTLRKATCLNEQFSLRYRVAKPEGGYRWVFVEATPSVSADRARFLGYLGNLEAFVGSDVTVAVAEIGSPRPPFDMLVRLQPTMIEHLADQVISARTLAGKAGETGITGLLDLALVEIGFRLASS